MEALLLAFGIALLPIYASQSGTVQYAHGMLAVFILIRLVHLRWRITWEELLLFVLVGIIFARQSFAVALGAETNVLLHALYLLFNALIVVCVSRVPLNEAGFRAAVKAALVACLVIAVGAVLIYGSGSSLDQRSVGSFNNPNQLGYFAICVTSLTAVFYFRGLISGPVCLVLWAATTFLVLASGSRGAVLAFLPGLMFGLAAFQNKRRFSPRAILLFLLVAGGAWYVYASGALDDYQFVERLKSTGERRYDSLAERGWSVTPDTATELLFGHGARGAELDSRLEIHSTFWAFMIAYGVIGFAAFMGVWLLWIKRVSKEFGLVGLAVIVLPATIYGLSHNGSRFTVLWLLIGFCFNRYGIQRPSQITADGKNRTEPMHSGAAVALGSPMRVGSTFGPNHGPLPRRLEE